MRLADQRAPNSAAMKLRLDRQRRQRQRRGFAAILDEQP
jgi:hypothetical protein